MDISLVGVGMGDGQTLTIQAAEALAEADAVLGAERLLEALPRKEGVVYISEALPSEVAHQIQQHPHWNKVCVALSGDVGFYSGAAKLREYLSEYDPQLICGISSPQQLAARLNRSWQDFTLVSAHSGDCDVLAEVLNNPTVFFLTGIRLSPTAICKTLSQAGLGDARVTVAENLCSPNERITSASAAELELEDFDALSVVVVDNQKSFTRTLTSPGIADDDFIRGPVPLTKCEVRVCALSELALEPHSVVWDVGAGTGSVAVEAALLARRGRVYAVECNSEACDLIRQNRERFGVYNLSVREGRAPEALDNLPTPTAVFVGGSKGNLKAIVSHALLHNPSVRIVITAIALETLQQAVSLIQECALADPQIVQITASRAHKAGELHMLRAENPVFIISGGGVREE